MKNYQTPRHVPSPASEIQRCRKRFYQCSDVFITDVLYFCLQSRTQYAAYDRGLCSAKDHAKPIMSCQLDTSELIEVLQQSAVEHLTKFRQLQVREFGSVVNDRPTEHPGIVTTDFEALYAYKCGKYQRCLQLSTHNVHALLVDVITMPLIRSYPEFIQLMDNNIASLVGLTNIVNMSSRDDYLLFAISQLSLSLYLMSQCQMKLHHSATSLTQTLYHIEVARPKTYCKSLTLEHLKSDTGSSTIDHLLLKLTKCQIQSYIQNFVD